MAARRRTAWLAPAQAAVRRLLEDPACQGLGSLHLVAAELFWDEEDLPFVLHGGGPVVRLVPRAGFTKDLLASSLDERLLLVDCPDDDGWLVPSGLVAGWMARHVTCPPLDDVLLAHPLYAHATKVDAKGRSRMGRGRLAHWAPGTPTVASLAEPPFTPGDRQAPAVNRDRAAYAEAVADLLGQLAAAFPLLEVEVGGRFGPPSPA